MSSRPRLVPSRQRMLDDLVAAVERPGESSELVVVRAPSGGGLSTFVRAFADRCAAGDVATASLHRLIGLPWENEPGAALEAWSVDTDSPSAAARQWLDALDGPARDADGRPVWDAVVLLEDAHHADAASSQVLVSAARRSGQPRVLVVLGWCTPAGPGELVYGDTAAGSADALLHDVVAAAARRLIRLDRLTVDDVGALAEQRGAVLYVHQLERLVRHTDGRIRDVVEILDDVPAADWSASSFSLPAPATAARAIRARLDAVSDDARAVVAAVAVLEAADRQARAVEAGDAGRVAGVRTLQTAIDEAVRSGLLMLLDGHGGWARLPGPVARRAVLDVIGPLRRSELHAVAADAVADPALSLRHRWFAAPRPDAALADRLEQLAGTRAYQGAWTTAADLLMLASRASEDRELRGARLLRAVDALVGAGEVPRASRHLAELEALRETPLRNAVLGYLAVGRGRPTEAESRLGRAWELVNPRRDPATASLVAQRYVLHHLARCRPRDLVEWADRAVEPVEPDAPTAVEAAAIRGLGVAPLHGTDAAFGDYRALMERVPQGPVGQRVSMASGWLHLAADDPERAREELESALPTDVLGGSLRISLWSHAWLARVQFQTGEWTDALRTATAGAELAERSGMNLLVPLLAWTRTQVHALRGDWDAAERSLRAGDARVRDYEIMRVPAAIARAALNEARADYGAVVRALEPLSQAWAREWVSQPGYWPWTDVYANALVVVGRVDEADTFLTHHEAIAEARDHTSTRARLAYARGRWHGMRGDLDAARASFEHAITLLEPLPLRYDRARVHFAYGQTLRRAGRRGAADAVVTTARDAYLALGAQTYVARCDRELAAGGVNVARGHREFDALTPQEEAVAGLVAQGMSNKEVAAELFLSVKTVQYHLTRIYAKIGVRTRAGLAARRAR